MYSDPTTVDITVVEPVFSATTLAGDTRFDTAVAVSKQTFPRGSDTVLIATGRNWPDALGGSALAGTVGGPILLSEATYIPESICNEIERLRPAEAIILGGENTLSMDVEDQLYELGVEYVLRLGGNDRYETAELVAEEVIGRQGPGWDGTVIVATGRGFADTLAGSPIAARMGWPIFLADPSAAPSGLVTTLGEVGADTALVLGGDGAVSPAYFSALDNGLEYGAERVWGTNRYSTAAAIASFGVGRLSMSWDELGIAVGTGFPDGLSGGVLCGMRGSVMLLTDGKALSTDTRAALVAHADTILDIYYFGGPGAISPSVRASIASVLEK